METEGSTIGLEAGPKPNVLLIEDEALVTALIEKYLLRAGGVPLPNGLKVETLASGWNLLTADLSHIKVAIVDILLPQVTGVDLIRDFRKRYPHMGVVPISGMATEPMKRQLREIAPETHLLAKPLRKEEFIEAFLKAWKHDQDLPQLPRQEVTPAQETGAEPSWSVVQGSQTNIVSVERRRLSRKKAA